MNLDLEDTTVGLYRSPSTLPGWLLLSVQDQLILCTLALTIARRLWTNFGLLKLTRSGEAISLEAN